MKTFLKWMPVFDFDSQYDADREGPMKQSKLRDGFRFMLLLVILVMGCSGRLAEQDGVVLRGAEVDVTKTAATAEDVQHYVVHIDPKSGKVVGTPTEESSVQSTTSRNTTMKAPPSLSESSSPIPGGGIFIQLDDRFMTPLHATINANDTVNFGHERSISAANELQQ